MINYSFDYVDYPQRFDRLINDNLRRIMDTPLDDINVWLNTANTQSILSHNQTKLINTKIPSLVDHINESIHG